MHLNSYKDRLYCLDDELLEKIESIDDIIDSITDNCASVNYESLGVRGNYISDKTADIAAKLFELSEKKDHLQKRRNRVLEKIEELEKAEFEQLLKNPKAKKMHELIELGMSIADAARKAYEFD